MNTKIIKKFVSGLLAAAACFTSMTFMPKEELSAKAASRTISNGIYYIRNRHSGKFIDIDYRGTANGTRVIQYDFNGGSNQQFKVTYESNGYYSIKPMHVPNQTSAIDMRNTSAANTNGTDAQIWKYTGKLREQDFIISAASGGGYQIGTRLSNGRKVLEVTNSSYANGETIQIWDYSTSRMNDNWDFISVQSEKNDATYFTLTTLSNADQKVAENVKSTFNRLGYNGNITSLPSKDTIGQKAKNSRILIFHGHGGPGYFNVNKSKKESDYFSVYSYELEKIISSNDWAHIDFVFFASCNSATTHSDRASLVDAAISAGAKCVIGFNGSVANAEEYLDYMMSAFANNPLITVNGAMTEADKHFSKTSSDSPAKLRVMKGNGNIKLNRG